MKKTLFYVIAGYVMALFYALSGFCGRKELSGYRRLGGQGNVISCIPFPGEVCRGRILLGRRENRMTSSLRAIFTKQSKL